jgi:hypothetical protein
METAAIEPGPNNVSITIGAKITVSIGEIV